MNRDLGQQWQASRLVAEGAAEAAQGRLGEAERLCLRALEILRADPAVPEGGAMGTERFETVIIGAGQAGLSVGYHLTRKGQRFVILDANQRVGDNWRCHWDSLRLYTPARYDGLPGMPFPASPWSFPTKDQVADYLEGYAAHFGLPVRAGVRVDRLSRRDGGYLIETGSGRYLADQVVVAAGTHGRNPRVPGFASELDPDVFQIHSSEYRNTDQLKPGPVLVVGAAHSGGDIALEVSASHPTVLCGPDTGALPFRIEGRVARLALPVLWLLANRVMTVKSPMAAKLRSKLRHGGAPLLRVKPADLAAAGVERVTSRVTGVHQGRPVLDNGRVVEAANVVWCTGFRPDFSWVDIPVFGDDGWPREECGVVPDSPGLYFCGLAFQRAFSSMLVGGAGRDAAMLAAHLVGRHRAGGGLPAAA